MKRILFLLIYFFTSSIYAFSQALQTQKNAADSPEDKSKIIDQMLDLEAKMTQRTPILESERDRLLKLTNALIDDNVVGCHFGEPIKSVQLVVDGSEKPLVAIGTFKNMLPEPVGGSPTALEFRLGGFTFTVDPATKILGSSGSHYEVDSDFEKSKLTLGSIEYVSVKKPGISYVQNRVARQSFIIMEDITYDVLEEHVYYINAIELIVNGMTVYKSGGLNWKFDRTRQIWEDGDLRTNSFWTKVMLQNDCKKTD